MLSHHISPRIEADKTMLGLAFLIMSLTNDTAPRASTIDFEHALHEPDWMHVLSIGPMVFILALTLYLKNRLNVIIQQLMTTKLREEERIEV